MSEAWNGRTRAPRKPIKVAPDSATSIGQTGARWIFAKLRRHVFRGEAEYSLGAVSMKNWFHQRRFHNAMSAAFEFSSQRVAAENARPALRGLNLTSAPAGCADARQVEGVTPAGQSGLNAGLGVIAHLSAAAQYAKAAAASADETLRRGCARGSRRSTRVRTRASTLMPQATRR